MPSRARARAAAAALLLLLHSVAGLGNETTVTAPPAAPAAPLGAFGASPAVPAVPALPGRARRAGRDRSTSSSSGDPKADQGSGSDDDKKESLDLDTLSDLTEDGTKGKGGKKYIPKSSAERRGWRKWHRKCTPCPEQSMKWRDPRILWICGGYQRARRSFKSACMMRYRNCQDGTMFVKIANHRCEADVPGEPRPHGEHFFYTYDVKISGDDTKDDDKSSSDGPSVSSDSSAARRRVMDWRPDFPPRAPLPANRTHAADNITFNMV